MKKREEKRTVKKHGATHITGNEGFGIVEVVLIIVVVIGLVIIFNTQITEFVNNALNTLKTTADSII